MRTVKVTRGGGASVVRGAAYRSSTRLVEEGAVNAAAYRSGDTIQGGKHTHDYSRKDGVLHSEILAPDHTPARLRDRGTLWNEADRIERNKNSQLARDWLFPLPKELTNEQNLAMIRQHIQERFVARGMIADLNVHEPSWKSKQTDSPNLHAHVMTTTRDIQPDGRWGPKSQGSVCREWQGPAFVAEERKAWRDRQNATFEKLGLDVRVYDGSRKLSPAAVAERDAADRERAEAFGAPVPEPAQKEREPRIEQPERSSPHKTEKDGARDQAYAPKGRGLHIEQMDQPPPPQTGTVAVAEINGARDQAHAQKGHERPTEQPERPPAPRQTVKDIRAALQTLNNDAVATHKRASEKITAIQARRKGAALKLLKHDPNTRFQRWLDDPLTQFLHTWERMDRTDERRRQLRQLGRARVPMRAPTSEERNALRSAKTQQARAGAIRDRIARIRGSLDRLPPDIALSVAESGAELTVADRSNLTIPGLRPAPEKTDTPIRPRATLDIGLGR
jgi:hypothetical protein